MLQFIPIKSADEKQIAKAAEKGVHYLTNEVGDSMAKKYNYAIDNFIKPAIENGEKVFCFKHEDLTLQTPFDVIQYKLEKLFEDGKVGVAGLIGTYLLEGSCTWWIPNREVNGAGSIIQGRPDGTSYPMNDWPGTHLGLATVDGCCMFLSPSLIKAGIRFDENLADYHFYDVDICCQARRAGLDVATVDIQCLHDSEGIPPENFPQLRQVFFDKWSKLIDHWPIGKYTIFK